MTAAKHTPGPWRFDHPSNEHVIDETYHAVEAGDGFICEDGHGFCIHAHMSAANARLISAAPELLEALDILVANLASDLECEGHNPEDDARVKLARAAIAKATGAAQ